MLGMLILAAARLDRPAELEQKGQPIVNDGDSLTIGTQRVRLRGIDAPEYAQTCRLETIDYACGKRSREALIETIDARAVSCTGSEHDRYGRLLAVCTAGNVDLNRTQVEVGWALAYGGYEREEAQAKRARAGIWAGSFERPQDWRRDHGAAAEAGHGDPPARIGDWLRQTLRFWVRQTYSPPMDSSGNGK